MATRVPPAWLDRAGALYVAGIRARTPLDRAVATFLRENKSLDEAGRGFAVDVAQGMWRVRRRVDDAAKRLGFEPTLGALACMYLINVRGVELDALPVDRNGARALREAWRDDPVLPSWLDVRFEPALVDALSDAPPTTLRANALKCNRDGLRAALLAEGIETESCAWSPDGVRLVERKPIFGTRAFKDGLFEMQDEGSQLIGWLCAVKPGDVVVDGCAGAGGKTLHLAAQMKGKGSLYALDVHQRRLDDLRKRAKRAGAHHVRVQDARAKKRLAERADVVLVDAPCSGTGVLRRNPDIAWSLAPDDVARLVRQQRDIVEGYVPLLKKGGRLVYATCSLLPEENVEIVNAVLAAHPELTHVPAVDVLAQRNIRVPHVGTDLTLDPSRHGTDGFFAAVMQRVH